jgi:hypothetical protein
MRRFHDVVSVGLRAAARRWCVAVISVMYKDTLV